MATTSKVLLAFALLLALAITSTIISADAGRANWDNAHVSGDLPPDVFGTFNLSGNSARQPMETPINHKPATQNTEDGWNLRIDSEPGFDILNALDGRRVEVQCINDNIPNPTNIVDQIIPVGGYGSWDLDNIDPGAIHVKYRCHFLETSASGLRFMDWEVWTDSWNRAVMPFYCIHCVYKVADDGLYVRRPNQAQSPYNYIKLNTWL